MKPHAKYCAVYTRKSTEEGLEQDFNTLDAQREACLSYIASQKAEGWVPVMDAYDDGGFSGGDSGSASTQTADGGYQGWESSHRCRLQD